MDKLWNQYFKIQEKFQSEVNKIESVRVSHKTKSLIGDGINGNNEEVSVESKLKMIQEIVGPLDGKIFVDLSSAGSDGPAVERKRKIKDPNRPKRKPTGYTIFVQQFCAKMKADLEKKYDGKIPAEEKNSDLFKHAASEWQSLDLNGKQVWNDKAKELDADLVPEQLVEASGEENKASEDVEEKKATKKKKVTVNEIKVTLQKGTKKDSVKKENSNTSDNPLPEKIPEQLVEASGEEHKASEDVEEKKATKKKNVTVNETNVMLQKGTKKESMKKENSNTSENPLPEKIKNKDEKLEGSDVLLNEAATPIESRKKHQSKKSIKKSKKKEKKRKRKSLV